MSMKKHKNKLISAIIVISVLVFAYWYGGDSPGLRGWGVAPEEKTAQINEQNINKKINQIPIKNEQQSATENNKSENADKTPMTAEEKELLSNKIAINIYKKESS